MSLFSQRKQLNVSATGAGPTDCYLRFVPELPGAARNPWPANRAYPEAVPRSAEKGRLSNGPQKV